MRRLAACGILAVTMASARAADPAAVVFTVDGAHPRPISPYIYGHNQADWKALPFLTLTRWGGNRTTAYNWENNASNAGNDWQHQNDGYLSRSDAPAAPVRELIAKAREHNAAVIITVPTIGHVAADKKGDGDVKKTPDYLSKRFVVSLAKKPTPFVATPDLADKAVYQDEFVHTLETAFGDGAGKPPLFYALDNEPDLWSETHARVHPAKITYEELIANNVEYAKAIKAAAPRAVVFGFASFGFSGFTSLQDAPDAKGRNVLDVYLAAMAAAEKAAGKRLIDVLDLHWYPEATGSTKVRITEDKADPATAEARIQAPRSLWDPTYTEQSWITKDVTRAPIVLLPTVKARIAKHYPGTKLALAEYYYGGGDHISGALAEADALGTFATHDLFAAGLWHVGKSKDSFIHAAFHAYLNYDGHGGRVGEMLLPTTSPAPASASVYVTQTAAKMVVAVAINKTDRDLAITVRLERVAKAPTAATLYRVTAAKAAVVRAGDATVREGALSLTLPPLSVTTIEMK